MPMSCRELSTDEAALLTRLADQSLTAEDIRSPELLEVLARLCHEGFAFFRGGFYQLSGLGFAHIERPSSKGILG